MDVVVLLMHRIVFSQHPSALQDYEDKVLLTTTVVTTRLETLEAGVVVVLLTAIMVVITVEQDQELQAQCFGRVACQKCQTKCLRKQS